MRAFVTVSLLLCAGAGSMAQVYYATLVGTVRDTRGGVIAAATVTAREISTGAESSVVTNASGDYRIDTLRPGKYQVKITASGFKISTIDSVELFVAQTSRVDGVLQIGNATETVTVSGEAPIVQTESAERGTVLAQREVEALPLQSRDMTQLTFLVPGVISTPSATGGYNTPMGNVNGNSEFSNQFNADGGLFTSLLKSVPIEYISIDSIEEFRVETSNYSAAVGLHAGGIVNIATKHGTNSFHGTLYEFFQNDKLSARNFFAAGKPPLRYNLYGGNFGGRIIRDKLFFFGSYEGNKNSSPVTFKSQVPTAAERQGNFAFGTGAKDAIIYDPYNLDASGMRIPYPNNTVTQDRWNAVATKYLALWPQANTPGIPNFIYNGARKNDYNRYSARIDYNISMKDTLFGRFGIQSNPIYTPGNIPGFGNATVGNLYDGQDALVAWDHVFSPSKLNQMRFSFANGTQRTFQSDFGGKNIAQQLGLNYASSLGTYSQGCPALSFGIGFTTVGTCSVSQNINYPIKTFYFTDDFTIHHGAHTIKVGFLTLRYFDDSISGRPGGTNFSFSGTYTTQINDFGGGQAFADFLQGYLGGLSNAPIFLSNYIRQNAYQIYFQDDWKATPKLTLQLGVRYDMDLPPYASDGKVPAWVDGLGSRTGQVLVFPANAKNAVQQALAANNGDLGFPYKFSDNNWLSDPHWRNVGPRLGFAYRPTDSATMVIRGGFGIFYDFGNTGEQHNFGYSLPFVASGSTPPLTTSFPPPPYRMGDTPPAPQTWYNPGRLLSPTYALDPNSISQARSSQWNITFQKGFLRDYAIEAAYVGNRSIHGENTYLWNRTYMPGYIFHYADGTSFTIQDDTPQNLRNKSRRSPPDTFPRQMRE
jgi:hypothetical protein